MMRKLIFILAAATLFSACNRGDSEVSFRLKYEQTFSIDSSIGVNFPVDLQGPPMPSRSEQAFQNNNTSADLITSVTMDYAEIILDSPADEDFSFLESIEISIEVDGRDPVVLAFADPVPTETGNRLVLTTSNKQFEEYITAQEFVIATRSVTDEFITEDHDFTFNCEFLVKANVLN